MKKWSHRITALLVMMILLISASDVYAWGEITEGTINENTVVTQIQYREIFEGAGITVPDGAMFGPVQLRNGTSTIQIATMIVEEDDEVAQTFLFDIFERENGICEVLDMSASLMENDYELAYSKVGVRGSVTATAYYNRKTKGVYYCYQPYKLEALSTVSQKIVVRYAICGYTYNSSLSYVNGNDSFDITISKDPATPNYYYSVSNPAPYYYQVADYVAGGQHMLYFVVGNTAYEGISVG